MHPKRKVAFATMRPCGKIKTRTSSISGEDIGQDESRISYQEESGMLHVLTKNTTESPIQKIKRVNTPTKTVHKQLFKDDDQLKAEDTDMKGIYERSSIIFRF
jgi:hypothetical protein